MKHFIALLTVLLTLPLMAEDTEFLTVENPVETKPIATLALTAGVSIGSDALLDINLMPASNLLFDDYMPWYAADVSAFTLSMIYGAAKETMFNVPYSKDEFLTDMTLTVTSRLINTLFNKLYALK